MLMPVFAKGSLGDLQPHEMLRRTAACSARATVPARRSTPLRRAPLRWASAGAKPGAEAGAGAAKSEAKNTTLLSLLSKGEGAEADKTVGASALVQLFRAARPEYPLLGGALLALLISSGATLVFPKAIGSIVDTSLGGAVGEGAQGESAGEGGAEGGPLPRGRQEEKRAELASTAKILACVFVVGSVASFGRVALLNIAGERLVARLRKNLFTSLLRKETAYFDTHRSGDMLSRISADTVVVSKAFFECSAAVRSSISAVGGAGILLWISPKLTMVSLAIMPAVGIGAVFYGRYVKRLTASMQDALGEATSTASERLTNIRTVKLFNGETKEAGKFDKNVDDIFDISRNLALASGGNMAFVSLAANGALLTVLWYGGTLVLDGVMSVGDLASFSLYSVFVGGGFTGLTTAYGDLMRAAGAGDRIFSLIDSPDSDQPASEGQAVRKAGEGIVPASVIGRLEFKAVDFSYPARPDVPVLQQLSFGIDAGETVAVVGASGGGKSTLLALLTALYRPQGGQVLFDGVSTSEIELSWLRDQIGVVEQEPAIFDTSLFENIAYGAKPGVTVSLDEVREAASLANADRFIQALPEAYDTRVGERGVALSGGQKQRVAIARALLKQPAVLVMDEATSALDTESERLVQDALQRIGSDRTCLTIAHRLSTIQQADRVVVLDAGRVAEAGTWKELRNKEGGAFRRLLEAQEIRK